MEQFWNCENWSWSRNSKTEVSFNRYNKGTINTFRTSFISRLIQIEDSEFSKLPRRYQNQQIIWKRGNKIYAMMPRNDSELDSDWLTWSRDWFSQSKSFISESVLREHFISNYIMGRQLALTKIDVSSIDMLFFPDQETFNLTTVWFNWNETRSQYKLGSKAKGQFSPELGLGNDKRFFALCSWLLLVSRKIIVFSIVVDDVIGISGPCNNPRFTWANLITSS